MSFQGRLFASRLFPSPTEEIPYFSSESRCIVDFGCSVFLVALIGDSPLRQGLFRLEVKREEIEFADDSSLSKDECVDILTTKVETLNNCVIVGVPFPFFHQSEIARGLYKERPCVALYGDEDMPPLYVPLFVGAPDDHPIDTDFSLLAKAPDQLQPDYAPNSIIDCTKVCTIPNTYNNPDAIRLRGEATFYRWMVNWARNRNHMGNYLRPTDTLSLRQQVVEKLITMARESPHMEYTDFTLQNDVGKWVEGRKLYFGSWVECHGEWVSFREQYSMPIPGLTIDAPIDEGALPVGTEAVLQETED